MTRTTTIPTGTTGAAGTDVIARPRARKLAPPTHVVVAGPAAGSCAAWASLLSVASGAAVTAITMAADGAVDVPADAQVVLVDVDAPAGGRHSDAAQTAATLAATTDVAVVVLTGNLDRSVIAPLLDAGIAGVISKHADADEVRRLVRAATDGHQVYDAAAAAAVTTMWRDREAASSPLLTGREHDVLVELIASGGASNRQIGEVLGVSSNTVKGHVSSLLSKLGVATRAGAIAEGLRLGLS